MAFLHGKPSFIRRQYVSPITMPNWLQYTDNDCRSLGRGVMGLCRWLGELIEVLHELPHFLVGQHVILEFA